MNYSTNDNQDTAQSLIKRLDLETDLVAIGMPAPPCFYADENIDRSGGAHNFKHYLENPVLTPDESLLPDWTYIRKMMDRKKKYIDQTSYQRRPGRTVLKK